MKLIREGRMGLPKAFKTGAIVGSYPKPMLVVAFKPEELDVIPSRSVEVPKDYVPMDVSYEDIVFIKPNELVQHGLRPSTEQPKVLCVDFGGGALTGQDPIDLANYKPKANQGPMTTFVDRSNYLCRLVAFPWKTVVFENLSDFSDIILQHIAGFQATAMNDARQWASMTGSKILQVITEYNKLPAHVVFIMHSQQDRNELTGQISEVPKIYSGVRDTVGKLFSSFFYATKENGKPVIFTTDRGFVRGIGARWPVGLPPVCGPDFKSVYGKELQ